MSIHAVRLGSQRVCANKYLPFGGFAAGNIGFDRYRSRYTVRTQAKVCARWGFVTLDLDPGWFLGVY